jgi:exodeoxyribonuclease III
VNGIRAVIGRQDLQDFIKKHNPDILCINETKVDDATITKLNLKKNIPSEYVQYWNSCKPPKKGYAGSAIYTKGEQFPNYLFAIDIVLLS